MLQEDLGEAMDRATAPGESFVGSKQRAPWTQPKLGRLKIALTASGDIMGNDGCGAGKGNMSFCSVPGMS